MLADLRRRMLMIHRRLEQLLTPRLLVHVIRLNLNDFVVVLAERVGIKARLEQIVKLLRLGRLFGRRRRHLVINVGEVNLELSVEVFWCL